MSKPTLKQVAKLLEVADQKETPGEQVQRIISLGLWSDLLDGNLETVDRAQFRQVLGLINLTNIDWQKTYKELGIAFPVALTYREDEFWYMPVTEEVTCDLVIRTLRRLGVTCDLYIDNLDADVQENDRHPKNGIYTIKVRRRIEADEEFKNLSADDLKKRDHSGITLLEYLLLFLGYYVTTKQYLDVENWTLCAGSRNSDGRVPCVHWSPGDRRLYVNWALRGSRYGYLRSRSVVSG